MVLYCGSPSESEYNSESVFLALTAERNCIWYKSLLTSIEEKAFSRSTAANQLPGNMLTCASNETTPVTATAMAVTAWVSI